MKKSQRAVSLVIIGLAVLCFAPGAPAAAAETPPLERVYLPLSAYQFAPDLRLTASADTYIFESDSDANRGSGVYLMAGYDGDDATMEGRLRTLIRFDLPASIAARAVLATLRVYYAGYSDFANQPRAVTAYAAMDAWDESTVAWVNQPPRGPAYGSIIIRANNEWGYREIDVTELVQQWADSTAPNYGLFLVAPEASGSDYSYRMFQSRETGHPPELIIRFQ